MNTSKDNEINQVQEETKEGMVVARGTPYNHGVDSVALRGQGENQLVARSADDGVSPVEGSSADMDDSASSSMESNDTYGSMAALFSYEARKQGMVTALEGGMHQESMPRFGFKGQLKQPMGNKKVGAPMVLNADMDQLGESGSPACYHTTVPQRARSFQDAVEMLHLTGDTGDSALGLRDAILISLYPELDDREYENRFLGMKDSDYWAEHAGQVRLVKCQRESELQGIEVEPWYFLYWSEEHQGFVGGRDLSLIHI